MKTNTTTFGSTCSRQGYSLVMVLLLTAVTGITLAGVMSRTTTTSHLNERSNQRIVSLHAAEAATEKIIARMAADYAIDAEKTVAENEAAYPTMLPVADELAFWGGFEFSDTAGTPDRITVERISSAQYMALDSQYAGLYGFASTYRIAATARQTGPGLSVPAAVQQEVQLAEIPVFQFAIFYNGLLEFTWATPLTVRGRVHANNNIYLGSVRDLTFHSAVTASGTIGKKAWYGKNLNQFTGALEFKDTKAENAPTLTLPIGAENTADAVREILYPPPQEEQMHSEMGRQRFFNKAEMVILVENDGITVQVKKPFDSSPVTIPAEQVEYFLSTEPAFTDQREGKVVSVTEIDVGKFGAWAATNHLVSSKLGSGQPPTILYVADNRTQKTVSKPGNGQGNPPPIITTVPVELAGVRLVNGRTLPTSGKSGVVKGLSVATPNPLYVLGDYNNPLNKPPGSNDTDGTEPAALFADALTILSAAWDDSKSAANYRSRKAEHTMVNAAIVTGSVYSQGANGNSPFSGGVMNLPRLLEDWGNGQSTRLTLNTSMVNLFNSAKATAPWRDPGIYYLAPIRVFNFDTNFTDPTKLPPGTPRMRTLIRSNWSIPAPAYASN